MHIAVASCWKYRDAWAPFVQLLDRFWPNHPMVTILTDVCEDPRAIPDKCLMYFGKSHWSWCEVLRNYTALQSEPFLLFQEDFFLHSPVNLDLIDHALTQMKARNAGAVRLYPVPGSDSDYGDIFFGEVSKGTDYRISCQATLWRPDYLYSILSQLNGPANVFELEGTLVSERLNDPVLAFKREVKPWPVEYLCSGISRGRWNPDSRRLFERHGINADYSLREMAEA